jgi:hypothetical protein
MELLMVVAVLVTVSAVGTPMVGTSLDASKTWGAAHYLAGRLNLARSEAVKRSVFIAVRVEPEGEQYRCTFYADGNRNGIRTRDITRLVDRPIGLPDRLHEKFGGVTFGILPGVTAIDGSEPLAAGSDPIRFGQSEFVSFNPDGSTTAGTFYIRGRRQQVAVRLLGVTGRLRVLGFDFGRRKWLEQ